MAKDSNKVDLNRLFVLLADQVKRGEISRREFEQRMAQLILKNQKKVRLGLRPQSHDRER
ncbi:hypothetical protein HYPGJ_31595 [Hyphomicrobium sp. GJ21]|uniref:hypothetical protein n=1 Tax=Hyphomicrobium sp. GJ21 TaxID=113574 RepID=UPI000622BB63|nr:hypothetical protein [Hyphomicrobium sp. GJ21]CEJ88102.1 hypothetical protein HYPGJ_31595 [Hyphomicrobium sp. GJ21]